jgi:hypothetical protein
MDEKKCRFIPVCELDPTARTPFREKKKILPINHTMPRFCNPSRRSLPGSQAENWEYVLQATGCFSPLFSQTGIFSIPVSLPTLNI